MQLFLADYPPQFAEGGERNEDHEEYYRENEDRPPTATA